ncbi:beta-galactosidase [Coraliomargarita sp. SDUM461004]|uniref:Beta-galactosidase n=1 Tax=Thalassobacterium sedimentorum TaxID=3041258 RepID=A0ABU1AQH7_9BACT|nr:beta-galactosidase [Coraliomargarita sp. SDUM461004]MDQ8196120.1 beta-galactosidase [Coraliomargarita sp. SDUM461004]
MSYSTRLLACIVCAAATTVSNSSLADDAMRIGINFRPSVGNEATEVEEVLSYGFDYIRLTAPIFEDDGFDLDRYVRLATPFLERGVHLSIPMDLRGPNYPKLFPEVLDDMNRFPRDQHGETVFQQGFRNHSLNHVGLRDIWADYFNDLFEVSRETWGAENSEYITFVIGNELSYFSNSSIILKPMPEGETYDQEREKKHAGYTRLRNYFMPELGNKGQFDQELRITDYNNETVDKFNQWLLERYGNLKAINAALGTSFASTTDMDAPRSEPFSNSEERPLWAAWMQFRYQDMADFFGYMSSLDYAPYGVTTNFLPARNLLYSPLSGMDYWMLSEYLDVAAIDYPDIVDLFCLQATDKPILIEEASIGYHPEQMYRLVLLAAASDVQAFLYWQTGIDFLETREEEWQGAMEAKPMIEEVNGDLVRSDTAVLWSRSSAIDSLSRSANAAQKTAAAKRAKDETGTMIDAIYDISGLESRLQCADYAKQICGTWASLMDIGLSPQIAGESTLLKDDTIPYDRLILPNFTAIPDDIFERLKSYEGHVVALGVNWGMHNEFGMPRSAQGRQELLGVCAGDVHTESASINFGDKQVTARAWQALKPMPGANVVATLEDGTPVGVEYQGHYYLAFDFLPSLGFMEVDGRVREVLDIRPLKNPDAQQAKGLLREVVDNTGGQRLVMPQTQGTGLWHTRFTHDGQGKVVLFDYLTWLDGWLILQDESLFRWERSLIQPRCLRPIDESSNEHLRPPLKNFTLEIPESWKVQSETMNLVLESNRQPSESSVPVKHIDDAYHAPIRGMEFMAVLSYDLSDDTQ